MKIQSPPKKCRKVLGLVLSTQKEKWFHKNNMTRDDDLNRVKVETMVSSMICRITKEDTWC